MEEDKIRITINDEIASQLERVSLDEASRKKVQIYQLKRLKEEHQAKLSEINDELAELRK